MPRSAPARTAATGRFQVVDVHAFRRGQIASAVWPVFLVVAVMAAFAGEPRAVLFAALGLFAGWSLSGSV